MKDRCRWSILFLALVCLVCTTGCFPGGRTPLDPPAGFFMGIWHGWIAPLSLIVSIFDPFVSMYETHNNGWWYDFGFYIAIISGFGGLSLSRKRKKTRKE